MHLALCFPISSNITNILHVGLVCDGMGNCFRNTFILIWISVFQIDVRKRKNPGAGGFDGKSDYEYYCNPGSNVCLEFL